jgi:capsular polysaccharide transport system ATP-binding protein
MIELQNLTKSYRLSNGERRYIFRDLNFSFPEGANIGLIGRNGAGKSTLLRLIGGIDTPDRGDIVTDKRISWPVGLSGGLQGSLTGRDGVKFVCRIYGMTRDEMLEKVRFVQDFAEIGDYFDQPVKSYSAGMRARLNFGLSWAFDFDYYLMDEVGAVGDARFKQKSRQLMEERIGQSNVILVSHGMPEIARLCNVVVLVNDGQAILYEDVDEGIRAYQETAGAPQPQRAQTVAGKGPMQSSGFVAPPAKAPSLQTGQDPRN